MKKTRSITYFNFLSNLFNLDSQYFIRNGFWVYQSYSISLITGFLITFIYGNFLAKDIFGQLTFVLSIYSFIGIFSLPGMGQALTLSIIQGYKANYLKAIKQTILFATGGSLILFVLAVYYFKLQQQNFVWAFILFALLFPLISFSTYYQAFLIAAKNFKKLYQINSLCFILGAVFTCVAVILKLPLVIILISSIAPALLVNLFFTALYLKEPLNKKQEVSFLKMGWHLSVTFSIHFLAKSLDKIILGLLLPFESLGLYAFALILPDQLNNLTRQVMPILLPKIARLSEKDIRKSILSKFFFAELIILILVIIYFLVSSLVFKLLFPKYLESMYLSQIYAFSLLELPTNLFNLSFQKFKLNKLFYIQEIFFILTLLVLVLYLTPKYGILGTIFAQVISKILYSILALFLFLFYIKKLRPFSKPS